jgi:NAD(P)-dependent dehydrogenase (short-subunit alcohol dehydrogenase family)
MTTRPAARAKAKAKAKAEPGGPRPARTVLVTGGNRGIGLEVCRQLAALGHRVLLGARDAAKGEAAARALGAGVRAVELDVADAHAAARLAASVGAVDVLISNAGVHYDDWQTVLAADWRIVAEAFATNCFGAWRLAQAFAPAMRTVRWGRIVHVSSEAGSLASMGARTPAYATSKAALNALTRVLAAELRGSGVLVNAVCPGWTATDMGGGGRPVADGARGVVWAATLPDDGPTGGFFRDGQPLPW